MPNNSPLFNPANVVNVVFWHECLKKGKPTLLIDDLKFLDFLQENDFGRYSWGEFGETFIARQVNGNISPVSTEQVRDFVRDYVLNLEGKITFSFDKKDLQLLLIKKPSLFSRTQLDWLEWLNATSHSQEVARHG